MDMYLSWCGPCDCIEQNYRTLGAKYDGRVEFYTACEDVIPEDIKMKLKEGPLTCQPRFVVFSVSTNDHVTNQYGNIGGKSYGRSLGS